MPETVALRINGNCNVTLSNIGPIDSVVDTTVLALLAQLDTGAGAAGAANQVFVAQRALQPSQGEVLNVYNFNGSNDRAGFPLTMATAKVMLIQNLNGTEANSLAVTGGGAGANGWTGRFSGTITVPGGATDLAYDTGLTGFAIGAASNNLLKITNNSSTGAVYYNVVFVGATS